MSYLARIFFALSVFSAPAYAAQVKLDCVYIIDGVDHRAKVELSDSTDQPAYKLLSVVINQSICKDYTAGSPKLLNGRRYLKYPLDCGDDQDVFMLYEGIDESRWFLARRTGQFSWTWQYNCSKL